MIVKVGKRMTLCLVTLSNNEKVTLMMSEKEFFEKVSNGDGTLHSRLIRFYNNEAQIIYLNPSQIVKISFTSKEDTSAYKIDLSNS